MHVCTYRLYVVNVHQWNMKDLLQYISDQCSFHGVSLRLSLNQLLAEHIQWSFAQHWNYRLRERGIRTSLILWPLFFCRFLLSVVALFLSSVKWSLSECNQSEQASFLSFILLFFGCCFCHSIVQCRSVLKLAHIRCWGGGVLGFGRTFWQAALHTAYVMR